MSEDHQAVPVGLARRAPDHVQRHQPGPPASQPGPREELHPARAEPDAPPHQSRRLRRVRGWATRRRLVPERLAHVDGHRVHREHRDAGGEDRAGSPARAPAPAGPRCSPGGELRSTTVVNPCEVSMSRHARLERSARTMGRVREPLLGEVDVHVPEARQHRSARARRPGGRRPARLTEPDGPSAAMRPSRTTTVPSSTSAPVAEGSTRACSTTQLSPAPASSPTAARRRRAPPRPALRPGATRVRGGSSCSSWPRIRGRRLLGRRSRSSPRPPSSESPAGRTRCCTSAPRKSRAPEDTMSRSRYPAANPSVNRFRSARRYPRQATASLASPAHHPRHGVRSVDARLHRLADALAGPVVREPRRLADQQRPGPGHVGDPGGVDDGVTLPPADLLRASAAPAA